MWPLRQKEWLPLPLRRGPLLLAAALASWAAEGRRNFCSATAGHCLSWLNAQASRRQKEAQDQAKRERSVFAPQLRKLRRLVAIRGARLHTLMSPGFHAFPL